MARKKNIAAGLDAVIYARYSSHNQREVSIEQQIAECTKHAAALGLRIVGTYEDRAISGKTDNRPRFQQMMRDAEKGKFQAVVAWKSNRIGRNMLQAMVNEAKLDDYGVKVFYAEEDFDDTAAGRFALRNMMNVNQFYSENMAEDITDLQEVIRALVKNGAMANSSCGIHVHVDGANHTPESLCRLLNFATGRQDLFYEALQIGNRADHWCHKINPALFREMKKNGRASRNDAERIWYSVVNDGYDGGVDSSHYNSTRYHGINLHAFFTKGTVEFRLFNGTTHAGRIKAYVQFCLAMSAWAINCDHDNLHFKSISGYTQQQKHDLMMRVLTKRLGMRGPEFKTARLHLTSAFLTEAESENTAA